MDLEHVLTDKTTPEAVLRAQLAADERLLWMGRPRAGWRPGDYGRMAVVLLCLLLAAPLVWLLLFFEPVATPENVLLVCVFLLPALGSFLFRNAIEVFRRARTVYAVTDRRILGVTGLRWRKIRSYPLRDLTEVTLAEELADGSGTIRFGPFLFDLIERAREVAEVVRRARTAARFPMSYPGRPAAETA